MAENMLSVVKYDAGGVEIKLEPETVKNYLVRGNGKVTDQEVLFFIRTCQAQKLNPLVYGEVYLIKFGNEPAQLVIGKETYMKRAFKNPNYNGMKSGIVVQRGEEIIQKEGTCLYPSETLLGGWCRVYHELNNKETETFKEVSLQEYQKFKDGKRAIEVRTEKSENGGTITVTVYNSGKNIADEDLERIWEKFYKTDKARTREYGGNGIGLSIVKAIMDSMGQEYGVRNVSDGVEFWFNLDCKS